jgi:hypothetical protein
MMACPEDVEHSSILDVKETKTDLRVDRNVKVSVAMEELVGIYCFCSLGGM